MPFSPVNWVDGVTPLNKANFDALQAGVIAAERTENKAVANGYASLDSGVKVPVAQLPTIPLAGITPGANGQWLKTAAGVPVWSAITAADLPPAAVPGYGTTLPGSPVDGQQHILVDSLTNPTWQWIFRYNAGSTHAYKWESIGSTPYTSVDNADVSTTSINPAYVAIGTLPSFIIPRTGDYEVSWGSNYYSSATAYGYIALGLGGSIVDIIYSGGLVAATWVTVAMRTIRLNASGVGNALQVLHAVGGGTGHFAQRILNVRPIRVL